MRTSRWLAGWAAGVVSLLALGAVGRGQATVSNIVVPQSRAWAVSSVAAERSTPLQVTQVDVGVSIVEQVATTTMDISLRNPTNRLMNAELVLPVPAGATVRGLDFQGAGDEPSAKLLPLDEAKATYQSIVRRTLDPAMLEFVGQAMIRSSVFPVAAGGDQKVRVTYEQVLSAEGARVDYELPRSESVGYAVPWRVAVSVRSSRPISTVYSPSHRLETARVGDNRVSARIAEDAMTEPGPFRLSYLLGGSGVSASLLAYPDADGEGGHFLLLGGLPPYPKEDADGEPLKREVTLVLDRSGSMRGEKIEQAREAALQVLAGLADGEAFNVIAYDSTVTLFARSPVVKSKQTMEQVGAFLKEIRAQGGTNIHDALLESLRQKPMAGHLPIVLFLTDGLPTVGQTSEAAIRSVAMKANPYERRVFTFGVGVDVNTPLLDKIALETRATSTFVLPKEDVEVKVAGVFRRLNGPVLASPNLTAKGGAAGTLEARMYEVFPGTERLADMFEGDQLVVLGRYRGNDPLTFVLSGNYMGKPRTFEFTFDMSKATTRNAFVPRLWASRKIASLVEAIRAMGADVATNPKAAPAPPDPRMKELVDGIVRLSTEYGVLTEYTAFLAREGTDLNGTGVNMVEALRNFNDRAIHTRNGMGSVNQEGNNEFMRNQYFDNRRNFYYDEQMNRVAVSNVQQINDRAFYRRGDTWVDSRVTNHASPEPAREIEFGSQAFFELAEKLSKQDRQGSISLHGNILLEVDDQLVLVKQPVTETVADLSEHEDAATREGDATMQQEATH